MKYLLLITTIALSVGFSSSTLACEAAGPTTHVGSVLKVDPENNTFTILDAQTVTPVQFKATTDIIEKVVKENGTAVVDYEIDGINLVATNVSFQ